jgi:hypothetical protein
MVIVDEMSMVDAMLMNALLKAISVGTRLILVATRISCPPSARETFFVTSSAARPFVWFVWTKSSVRRSRA